MKKSVMLKWVKALRSGKYTQGVQRLVRTEYRSYRYYCCLGVLCEISGLRYNKGDYTLPGNVLEWSGVKDSYGTIDNSKKNLVRYNDDLRYSFKRIATIIEKNWKNL